MTPPIRLVDVLLLLAAFFLGAAAVALFRRLQAGRRLPSPPRWTPSLLVATATVGLAVLGGSRVTDQSGYKPLFAQGITALMMVGLLIAVYLLGRRRAEAREPIAHSKAGAPVTVQRGAIVDPREAEEPESAGKVKLERVALADFQWQRDDDTYVVLQGAIVDDSVAARPEAKGKVGAVFTATAPFLYSPIETTEFAPGAEVPEQIANDPSYSDKVVRRRRFFLRGLLIGKDGRWSTSKLQALLWTAAVLYGLTAIAVAVLALGVGLDINGKQMTGHAALLALELPDEYYLLLGGPFAAAIAAKALITAKVASGTVVKTDSASTLKPTEGLAEAVSDDEGNADLFDFQYFVFNLLALGVFAVTFASGLEKGLPELPEPLARIVHQRSAPAAS